MVSLQTGWEIYRQQMGLLGHGDALWEPAPIYSYDRVRLGDVGYIRSGRFHLLFSAGYPLGERRLGTDVPPTFEPLDVGPIIPSQPRLPGCLRTSSVKETGFDLGASLSVAPALEPGARISLELAQERGAALVTKHHTYREDIEHLSVFEEYTRKHYDSWVKFSSKHGSDVKPVLVTGIDMTRDFAMMAYANNDTRLSSEFTVSVPLTASASASVWGTWRTDGLVHTNCGPQVCTPPWSSDASGSLSARHGRIGATHNEYNQCIFIRYFTVRKRAFMFPKVIKAGAGPHDLGPGNNCDETSPELTVSGTEPEGNDDSTSECSGSSTNKSDLEVLYNVFSGGEDPFDIIAEYIFRNSEAEAALIHYNDIILIREGIPRTGTTEFVSERLPEVVMCSDGVGMLVRSTKTFLKANLAVKSQSWQDTSPPRPIAGPTGALYPGGKASEIGVVNLDAGGVDDPEDDVSMDRHRETGRSRIPTSADLGSVASTLSLPLSQSLTPEYACQSHECCDNDSHLYIPQRPWAPDQRAWPLERFQAITITFRKELLCGILIRDGISKHYQGLDGRDSGPFENADVADVACLRINWPGYPTWSRTFRTRDTIPAKTSVRLSRLATDICRAIERFLIEMESEECTLQPAVWRVGRNTALNVDTLALVSLRRVSMGSWMADICVASERETQPRVDTKVG